jgi:hypothetical protein
MTIAVLSTHMGTVLQEDALMAMASISGLVCMIAVGNVIGF